MNACTITVRAAAAVVSLAVTAGVQAVPIYSVETVSALNPAFGLGRSHLASGHSGVAIGESAIFAVPVGLTTDQQYFYVTPEAGSITVDVGARDFSFLWGSPDLRNQVTYHTNFGDYVFSGADLWSDFGIAANGDRSISALLHASVAEPGALIDSVTFQSGDWSFEYAVAAVAEPGALALAVTALCAAAWTGRRRIATLKSTGPRGIALA